MRSGGMIFDLGRPQNLIVTQVLVDHIHVHRSGVRRVTGWAVPFVMVMILRILVRVVVFLVCIHRFALLWFQADSDHQKS